MSIERRLEFWCFRGNESLTEGNLGLMMESRVSSVAPLDNPRHEQFAQLVAIGQSPAQAYASAGYEEKASYTCGPRLLRRAEVRARVTELQQTIAKAAVSKTAITRETVL